MTLIRLYILKLRFDIGQGHICHIISSRIECYMSHIHFLTCETLRPLRFPFTYSCCSYIFFSPRVPSCSCSFDFKCASPCCLRSSTFLFSLREPILLHGRYLLPQDVPDVSPSSAPHSIAHPPQSCSFKNLLSAHMVLSFYRLDHSFVDTYYGISLHDTSAKCLLKYSFL